MFQPTNLNKHAMTESPRVKKLQQAIPNLSEEDAHYVLVCIWFMVHEKIKQQDLDPGQLQMMIGEELDFVTSKPELIPEFLKARDYFREFGPQDEKYSLI
jgi:hypothetical protein